MTPIYMHEYTLTSMQEEKMGIRAITIIMVTDTQENQHFEAVESAIKMLDGNLNISHKIVLTGYQMDSIEEKKDE